MDARTFRRFAAKVTLPDEHGCMNWTGWLSGKGYGRLYSSRHSSHPTGAGAHRLSYEHFVGPIPDGMTIDHLCLNRRCVAPSHLRLATNAENAQHRLGRASSGVRGVHWSSAKKKYYTRVHTGGRFHSAGHFDSLEEAAEAVVALRLRLFTHSDPHLRPEED